MRTGSTSTAKLLLLHKIFSIQERIFMNLDYPYRSEYFIQISTVCILVEIENEDYSKLVDL